MKSPFLRLEILYQGTNLQISGTVRSAKQVFDFWQSIKDSFRYYDKNVLITMSMNERSQGQKGIRHAMSHGGRNQTPVLLFFFAATMGGTFIEVYNYYEQFGYFHYWFK